MSHKNVSNKAVVKDSAFLAKLSGTMARRGPNPMEQGPVRSQVAWKKTSNVKYRLKTLTGTIPIYDDMTEEQVEDVKRKHGLLPGTFPEGIPPPPPGEEGGEPMEQEPDYEVMEASSTFTSMSATKVHKQSTTSVTRVESSSFSHQEQGGHMESYTSSSSSRTRKKMSSSSKATEHLASTQKEARTSYVALEGYSPDDYDGLALTAGQKVFLLSQSSPNKKARLEGSDDISTGEAPQLLDNSLAKQKAAIRPKKNHPSSRSRGLGGASPQKSPEPQQAKDTSPTSQEERWLVQDFDTGREGYVPARLLEISKQAAVVSSIKRSVAELSGEEANQMKLDMLAQIREFRSKRPQRTLGPTPEDEARAKRTATIQELIETEEEFVRDLKFAMNKYYRLMDDPATPYHIREHKDIIFNNFRHIADFHENVLIEGVKYNAEVPLLIGKTFLRLERDFDKHAEYCSNEPLAQDFVDNNPPIRDYFNDYSNKIGDEKRLQEHLKLPIQRLNDYQLLLRELVKFSDRLGDNTEDLQRAFELMQTIPQRATDAKFISSIEGFKGNLFKLGRLVRHDWFTVSESSGKPRDRYLFLFKARVLITKVKRISEDRSIFVLKDIIRLPETNIVEEDSLKTISFNHIEPQTHTNFPLVIEARNAEIREAWFEGIKEYVVDTASVEDLLFDDELRVVSADVDEEDAHVIASPVPEIQEFEDLPEDSPQRSPAKQSPKAGREPSPPPKRAKADQSQRATGTPVQVEVEKSAESVVDAPSGTTPTPQTPTPSNKVSQQPPASPKVTVSTQKANMSEPQTPESGYGLQKTPATASGAPRPIFTTQLKGECVEPGEGVKFVCEVAHPVPYFVTWLKDSKPLDDKLADRVQQVDDGITHALRILNCRKEDSGTYTAKAADEVGGNATSAAQLLVQELTPEERAARIAEKTPFFMVKMKDTHVIENTNLSYCVNVRGEPHPEVTFYKDNEQLKEDSRITVVRNPDAGHYELCFVYVTQSDGGRYKAIAKNSFGKAECEANMVVTEEEVAYQKLAGKGSLMAEGEKADFKWFRDGVEYDPLERFNVMFRGEEDTLALVFQNVTPEDAGLYTCVASTSGGKISCSAELTVEGAVNRLLRDPEPPAIIEELQDVMVAINGTAMLECKVTGFPKPELKWSKNFMGVKIGGRFKQILEDDDSVTLIIKNIEEFDDGNYRIMAVNELGDAESECTLKIKSAPKIKKMKKDAACKLGINMQHTAEVHGEPKPKMKWLKDGKPLYETDRVHGEWLEDNIYCISWEDMEKEDCATYTLVAENDMGVIQESFELEVDSPPEIMRGLESEMERKAGGDFTMEIRCKGSPKPMARWFKDGKELDGDGDKYVMKRDETFYTLKIKGLNRHDKGTYKVQMCNSSGEAESEGSLIVRAPPDFTTPLRDASCKEGTQNTKLFVQWVSTPPATVRWFFGDKEIKTGEDTPGYMLKSTDETSSLLNVLQALPEFCGVYTVKASNEYGETKSTCKFRLYEAPVITEPLQDLEMLEDMNHKWAFRCTGVPVPDIKWTKDGKKFSPDERRVKAVKDGDEIYRLDFSEAKVEDTAEYVATLTNAVATVTTQAKLVTNTPPHVKTCNFAEGKSFYAGHKFVLSIECTSEPLCEATWYWGDKEMTEADDNCKMWFDPEKKCYFLERFQTDTDHCGTYKVVLKNKIGTHEQQGNVKVTEKEARVRQALEDACVRENSTAIMKCQIVGDPTCEITWLKDGKKMPTTMRIQTEEDRVNGWHTITIAEVTERDNCEFTCKGVNKHGSCETTARLGVLVAPQPGDMKDSKVDYGKDLTIFVSIHAFPKPDMKWFLGDRELPTDQPEKYSYDYEDGTKELHSITIHNCVLEDAGHYKFVSSNEAGQASKTQNTIVHTEKPTVVTGLSDEKICLEDTAILKIQLAGLPLPDVTWLNKEKPVSSNPRYIAERPDNADYYHLTIQDVCMEDYGHLTAVGKSLVGECHTVCSMEQKKLPCSFVQGLENVTKGAEGDDVTLTVKIKASPRPTFQWFKDGDVLEESEKVTFSMTKTSYCEATITVTLVEASSLESGQYKLKITNEVNDASTETALICRPVRRKPKITKKPENVSCQEKEGTMFKCKINGFPKPDVKWLKDGRPLSFTETTDSGMTAEGFYYFEFKSVTSEDAGLYTIVAENDEGKTSAECSLEVIPPPSKPEFLMGLKASKVIEGYPARFEVKCGGYPPPVITWLKDGVPLVIDGKHLRQVVLDDGTVQLLIDNCTEADAGKYTCQAQSSEGQIESTADMTVLGMQRKDGQPDGPAKFSEGLRDCCFDESQTIKLPVAMKGGPVPIMKWYKDGEEIKLGDGVFFTYDGDRAFLEITPAKGSDAGMYKCVIQNDMGKDETECEVTIRKCYEAPSIGSCFSNVCQLPGREARFPVHFDGVPKPEFTWYKDGEPIVIDGEKYRIKKDGDCYTLIIADCTYGDSGVIKVVLKNREGEISHEGNLEVGDNVDPNRKSEAPNFLKTIGDQELYEGYIAKFKAVVTGSPFPEFEFTKDGGKVYSTNRIVVERDSDGEGLIRLTIKQVRPEDAGNYTLRVWNEHGEKSCSGKLICESLTSKKKRPVGDEYEGFPKIRRSGVPMPLPDKPYISALSDRRVTLSWMPYLPQGPTMPVTYQIEMCEAPDGEYFTVRSGIRGCKCDILNLNPKLDYRFRVRVENKFGVSEASPYVQTYRYKLEQEPVSYEPKCDPNYVYKGEGPYVPEGFRIERTSEGNYFAAPRFLRLPHETQYGIKGFNSRVKWYAFGWPTPKLQFLFNEQPIKTGAGTRFTISQEASGEIILFVDKMQASDVGWYTCVVKNEHGQSSQRIKLQMAEFPKVTEHLEEVYLRTNTNGKLMCRIEANPLCEVTWFKDWEPLTPSYRFRPQFCADDMYILHLNGASLRDSGFYSVSATNAAGTVMSSCYVHVEEEDLSFNWSVTGGGKQVIVNQRRGTLEDTYDVGDELGRGTQGVTYHCVERYTGRNFAAKSMWGRDKLKVWMHMEFEMMNLVNNSQYICRLFDAYEGPKNMVLVQELCSGGDLLYHLTQQQFITEYEVAHYIRQVLLGLEYMHDRCLAHCGLNIGDILLTRPNGRDIKLCDLSLARHIRGGKLQPLDYGMPEFVAPEVANGENISYGVDMWAVGIISYLLLSGTSPFRGEHDRETLSRIQKGDMSFDMEAFTHISNEAKDFIARLLKFEPDQRLDVKGALMHPWIAFTQQSIPKDVYKINTDRLRTYYVKYRDWYANASCKRWFRRRTLSSAFTHPSKMVYPPGEVYTPPDSPEREILPVKDDGYFFEERDLSYQVDVITNDSQYQSGPDTFLMQLRDVDFPVRLRQYMKVAEERSPAFNMYMRENQYDYSATERTKYVPRPMSQFKPTQFVVWNDSDKTLVKSEETTTEETASGPHVTAQKILRSRWDLEESKTSIESAALAIASSAASHKVESFGASNVATAATSEEHHHLSHQQQNQQQNHCYVQPTYNVQPAYCYVQPTYNVQPAYAVQPRMHPMQQRLRPMSGYYQGPEYDYGYQY